MVARYETALANRSSDAGVEGIDHDLVRRVVRSELKNATAAQSGENVFTVMRRIGQAKAELAADYAAQLARSAGKVVFFAKHIGVMDEAEETFARQGVRFSSIRGDQTPTARQANVDAFVNDPDVAVAVCSLTAAGVGLIFRSPQTSCWPSCPGPTRNRPRPSIEATASGRPNRSPRGASSPRRPSTPGSPS